MSANTKPMSGYLSTADLAKRFGRPVRTIQHWLATGILPSVVVGRDRFVREADLDKFTLPSRGRKPKENPD